MIEDLDLDNLFISDFKHGHAVAISPLFGTCMSHFSESFLAKLPRQYQEAARSALAQMRITPCLSLVLKGKCKQGGMCPYSHELSDDNTGSTVEILNGYHVICCGLCQGHGHLGRWCLQKLRLASTDDESDAELALAKPERVWDHELSSSDASPSCSPRQRVRPAPTHTHKSYDHEGRVILEATAYTTVTASKSKLQARVTSHRTSIAQRPRALAGGNAPGSTPDRYRSMAGIRKVRSMDDVTNEDRCPKGVCQRVCVCVCARAREKESESERERFHCWK